MKLKKQSGVNSVQQLEELVLFLDRNLGRKIVSEKLRATGMKVEIHDEHLPMDAPDEDWIALVGKRGWTALTKDKNIRFRSVQLEMIKKHRARVIVIRAKDSTGSDIAELLIKGREKISRFVSENTAPFVGAIDRSGRVRQYVI